MRSSLKLSLISIPSALALALALAGCAETSNPQPATDPTSVKSAQATQSCPFGVRGAEVLVTDTADGAVMTFTVTPDKLDDLRERVADAAAMHGPGEQVGKGHDPGTPGARHGDGGNHGLKAMQFPPMRAVAEKMENGTKLTLTAQVPADAPALQAKARERAKAMAESCDKPRR
jgi:hypothetical protein